MKGLSFHRNKYGKELLIDCERMTDVAPFVKDQTPFLVDFHEVLIVTSGTGRFRLDSEEFDFFPGTVMLLPPNKWRQWLKIEGKLDGFFLIFEEEFVANFFNDRLFLYRFHYFYNHSTPSYVRFASNHFDSFLQRLEEVRSELKRLDDDSEHFLRSVLYYILITINRIYKQQFNIEEQFFENNLTLRFRKLLEKEVRSHHQVTFYVDALQVSKSHLNKTLKESMGRSTSEIIKQRLLAEAKRELLYSQKSVAEISYQLNFSEPSNFNRFFKDLTKVTPKEYRQQNPK